MSDRGDMISARPLPLPDDATFEFWAACQRHELRMQRCVACAKVRFPPRPMCPRCQSFESEWPKMSGKGTLYSFVIAHPPVLPAFAEKAPYPVVLVALDEDPTLRMIGTLVAGEPSIGAPVEVAFEQSGEMTLPTWRMV